jgi:hypothetical protein
MKLPWFTTQNCEGFHFLWGSPRNIYGHFPWQQLFLPLQKNSSFGFEFLLKSRYSAHKCLTCHLHFFSSQRLNWSSITNRGSRVLGAVKVCLKDQCPTQKPPVWTFVPVETNGTFLSWAKDWPVGSREAQETGKDTTGTQLYVCGFLEMGRKVSCQVKAEVVRDSHHKGSDLSPPEGKLKTLPTSDNPLCVHLCFM